MAEPGIIRFTFSAGDNGAEVVGEITETVTVGNFVDVLVNHASDALFWTDTIYMQAEEGVRVEIMAEHRQPGWFALRITNEGTDESAYFDPYHLDPYLGANDVRVTFSRKGFLQP